MKLDFNIPEKYISYVSYGQTVHFNVSNLKEDFTAKVIATETSVQEQSRDLKVRSIVQSNTSKLAVGSYVNILFQLNKVDDALIIIPTQALIPQARDKKVIVVKNGKASFIKVLTGYRNESDVEVEGDLHFGDTVVTSGLLFIKPDARVEFSSFIN